MTILWKSLWRFAIKVHIIQLAMQWKLIFFYSKTMSVFQETSAIITDWITEKQRYTSSQSSKLKRVIFPFRYIYSIWLDLLHDDVRNYRDEQCYTQLVGIMLNRFYLWIAGLRFIALKKIYVPLSSLKKCNCKRIIQSLLIAFGFIEFIWESEIIEEIEIYCCIHYGKSYFLMEFFFVVVAIRK